MGPYGLFRCQLCGCSAPAGARPERIAVETRPREYPFRREANRPVKHHGRLVRGDDGRVRRPDDPGGSGEEIVREVLACPACAAVSLHPRRG
jgi:hypothetical protein